MQNTITLQQQATLHIGKAVAKKDALKKNALFVAIITCIVLAVNF
ncbi:MAG: hypothetical protein R2800_02205 [Flavipsychrobacter sp.]